MAVLCLTCLGFDIRINQCMTIMYHVYLLNDCHRMRMIYAARNAESASRSLDDQLRREERQSYPYPEGRRPLAIPICTFPSP